MVRLKDSRTGPGGNALEGARDVRTSLPVSVAGPADFARAAINAPRTRSAGVAESVAYTYA
jgi:hypothetical protein